LEAKHIIKSRLLRQGNLTDYALVDKRDNELNKINVELDIDKDEDLDDILSNDFWDEIDGGEYLKQKQSQQA